ncbi:hypothetical protein GPECTOR_81g200 [Gonium pectorale]|uniref:Ankyrin repeat domain-containing protein n=1 Tax=Gonium pectorale TaxID=33097 RepID=A0A150G359_GONPE|nr:hypothetical protein GPECTOR_81g200 [Gonium pectorale]|eukprot:KXZ43750.1 hypothetical protein GPECTOR_81g200 [Gonium pectorale]
MILCVAAPPLPNIWLPELVERFASFLHHNDVMCTLRVVDKATAEQFRGRPEFPCLVRLSQPVPPHMFARRCADPGAMRDLSLGQRTQLLRLTAASGVVANLEVAMEAVGFVPDANQLSEVLKAAAAAGHVDAVRHLVWAGRQLGTGYASGTGHALGAAVKAGHMAVCEALVSSCAGQRLWGVEHVAAALQAGRPELADWLLQRWPEGPIGPGDSLAPLNYGSSKLLEAAAEGCNLATLRSLHLRYHGVHLPQSDPSGVLSSAAGSPTADWQAKVRWAESQLPPGVSTGPDACAAAVACPDAELRLAWLLRHGYSANEKAAYAALCAGNAAALELLLARGLRPGRRAIEQATCLGRLEALKKLHEHGCPLVADDVSSAAAEHGHLPVLVWAVEELGALLQDRQLAEAAAKKCDMEALQWLWQRGCPLNAYKVALAAAEGGNLPVLVWAVEELGAQPTSKAFMEMAASSGCVKLMAWLREHGCPWDENLFRRTASAGCEAALEWLVERGCPMPTDGGPYVAAARNNDLATLSCLARLGCPWGPASGAGAVFETCIHSWRPLPVLRCLFELGCPVTAEDCFRLAPQASAEVHRWLVALARAETARWREWQQQQERLVPEEQRKRQREE